MKLIAVLSFAVATALAAPNSPPKPAGCVRMQPGPEPGTWVGVTCPPFAFPPGSECHEIPGDPSKEYPDCCPEPSCPGDANWKEPEMSIM